jgi:hypothetical protein
MYEKPELNRVGDAQEVILGFISYGEDMDSNWVPTIHEWADEDDDRGGVASKA